MNSPKMRIIHKHLTSLAFLLHRHYLAQILLVCFFLLQRKVPCLLAPALMTSGCGISTSERQVLMLLCITLSLKARHALTLDSYLATVFLLAQVANVVLLARQQTLTMLPRIAITAFYCILLSLRIAFLPQPPYEDPGRSLISYLGIEQFIRLKRSPDKSAGKEAPSTKHILYFVCVFTTGSAKCNAFAAVFSKLAWRYGKLNPNCKFVKVNVSHCTSSQSKAIKDTFNVDVSTLSTHLPTLLLMNNGTVLARAVPQQHFMSKHYVMNEQNLIRDLQIDRLIDQITGPSTKSGAIDKDNQAKKDN